MNILAINQIEEWRAVPGWPEYEASSLGRVRRVTGCRGTRSGKILKQTPEGDYFKVSLSRNSIPKRDWVHRIIALAFYGYPPDPSMEVAHGDNDGTNNLPSNLRWATRSSNSADRVLHGTHIQGEFNPCAKLNGKDILKIRQSVLSGCARKAMAAEFHVAVQTIDDIVNRRRWRHIP